MRTPKDRKRGGHKTVKIYGDIHSLIAIIAQKEKRNIFVVTDRLLTRGLKAEGKL